MRQPPTYIVATTSRVASAVKFVIYAPGEAAGDGVEARGWGLFRRTRELVISSGSPSYP
jgi:hypothetical protein